MRKPKVGNPCLVITSGSKAAGKIISSGHKWIRVDICPYDKFSATTFYSDYGHRLFIGTIDEYNAELNQKAVEYKLREEIIENLEHLCEDNLIKIRDMTSEMF